MILLSWRDQSEFWEAEWLESGRKSIGERGAPKRLSSRNLHKIYLNLWMKSISLGKKNKLKMSQSSLMAGGHASSNETELRVF